MVLCLPAGKVVVVDSQHVVAKAKRLIEQREFAKAKDLLAPWLREHPDDGAAWAVLGAAEFNLGDLERARRAAEKVTLLRPDSAQDWCNLGTILRKSGLHDEAEKAQGYALALDADYGRAKVELKKIRRARADEAPRPATEQPSARPRPTAAMSRNSGAPSRRAWLAERRWAMAWGLVALALVGWLFVTLYTANTENRRRREVAAEQEAAATQASDEQGRKEAEQRRKREAELIDLQMRRNRFAYVDDLQSPTGGAEDQTDAQRKASWDREFKGQWLRWEGTVVEVTGGGDTCRVSMRCGAATPSSKSDTKFKLDRATAVTLKKGQLIRIEGRLDDHSASGYTLEDVRVVAKW